jgi:glutathione S-transferase
MLKIWGRANSSNVMKVLWLCDELGIAYEREDAGGAFGRTREPFYLAMNPNARVPTIEEPDGYSLWESHSILRYLVASRAPGHALHPTDPRARADVERWMDWLLATLNPPMTTLFWTFVRTPEDQRDLPAAARARDEAEGHWGVLARQLEGRDYVAGGFSLADVCLGPFLHRWFELPVARPAMPALEGYRARLHERHAGYRAHVAVRMS